MPATNEVLQEGRYRINQQFPINGQGAVFDAYDTVRETKVLVKEIVMRQSRVSTPSQQEQLKVAFANHAKVLTEVKHPALLNVHDFFSEIGRQYLVMEALDGHELSDLIAREGSTFKVSDIVRWADELLDGLQYLHSFQPSIIHKNIRPNHIKLTVDGKIKLLAFGLADGSDTRISTNTSSPDDSDISYAPLEQIWENLDSASQKVITNSYSEQEERSLLAALDARSDLYSIGATIYHLATGKKPVDALERSIEMLDGNSDPLEAPSSLNPAIPTALSDVILRSMQIKRSDRYISASVMREAMRSAAPSLLPASGQAVHQKETVDPASAGAEAERKRQEAALTEKRRQEAEQKRRAETQAIQARHAEEQRLLAEKEAAEAEQFLREKEAEEAARLAATTSFAPADKSPERPVGDDFRSVLVVDHDGADQTARYEVETAPAAAIETASTVSIDDDEPTFSFESTSRSSSLPIPAIAGGAVLVLLIAFGGWFALSSRSDSQRPAEPVQTQMSAQPGQPETQVQPDPAAEQAIVPATDTSEVQPADAAPADPDQAQTRKPAPAVPAKKPATDASKQPQKKKALTVEDLINDN